MLKIGADKVIIKSKAIQDSAFIQNAVRYFGSQCISISVDVVKTDDYYIFSPLTENLKLEEFILNMNNLNVGEFIVNSVDNDGMMEGFDSNLYLKITKLTDKPVVALGGAGEPNHFIELVEQGFWGGLASSSIYHFTQYTPNEVKRVLKKGGVAVRL